MTTTTTGHQRPGSAEHSGRLATPPAYAYELVADVTRWPLLFTPCVHAEVLESGPGTERVRLWALTGEQVRGWTSRRTLDSEGLRVGFRQEDSAPPLAAMGGEWRFTEEGADTLAVLAHDWTLTEPGAAPHRWVTETLDRNSTAEIGAVTAWAARTHAAGGADALLFSFTDSLDIAAPAPAVYAFLDAADQWPARLPHVSRVAFTSTPATPLTAGAEVQHLEMETRADDGTRHLTRSIRLGFAGRLLVYKQTTLPAPLLGHAGSWALEPLPGGGTRVTARHRVALDPDAVTERFGAGTTLAAARDTVRALLGGNSRRTLEAARAHTEAAGER
ncbi:aromatase [Streptomyces sp. TverLS-915]|uniref:aromatase/cyclase n=1 Tax=Streptomyces sp. TverLS-915 TaxID=1839763 RepID=UPI00081D937A|nr:aromatase/cyclase [Streptomyces sp. TverLS-915]SCD48319.1 aromatase [Streptomyces sp. TverLS-915]